MAGRAFAAFADRDAWRSYLPLKPSLSNRFAFSAYGRARAVQAICDFCGRAHRPQGDKFADFLAVQRDMAGLAGQGTERLVACLPIAAPFWRLHLFRGTRAAS